MLWFRAQGKLCGGSVSGFRVKGNLCADSALGRRVCYVGSLC